MLLYYLKRRVFERRACKVLLGTKHLPFKLGINTSNQIARTAKLLDKSAILLEIALARVV